MTPTPAGVDLYWLPLGAGGQFVAFNGRVYEAIRARREHREPLDLYHTALIVTVPEGLFVVENAWPIPDSDGASRGVVVEGPVGSPLLGRLRVFRYEIRCWRDGTISDVAEAVGGARRISDNESHARRVLELLDDVPPLLWGRRPAHSVEMWNSNSVISWLLARSGIAVEDIHPPPGGRAPGWSTGLQVAGQLPSSWRIPEIVGRTALTAATLRTQSENQSAPSIEAKASAMSTATQRTHGQRKGVVMKRGEATGLGIALGAGIGAAFGVIFGNIAMGVALGAGLGVVVGSLISWGHRPAGSYGGPS